MHHEKINISCPFLSSVRRKPLTLREIRVRKNRTAATTRYFSFLRVKVNTLYITSLRRKLHLQEETNELEYNCHRRKIKLNDHKTEPKDYFILYGWCKTQKHSSSHMFSSISGFIGIIPALPLESADLLTDWPPMQVGEHDDVITSIS